MSDTSTRVAALCRRHDLLPSGRPVLAMVSGGADSLCLLHLLCRLHNGPVGVLAVDHGLRPEAAGEVESVARQAAALGCRMHRGHLSLETGAGVQARAREARLELALRVAGEHGYERIALGHTATDQAETVLFRLARGTGTTGALGIAPRRDLLVRPLLDLTRAQTRAWCADHAVSYIDDPSNADRAFARVRVRADLLPALEAVHPDAVRHTARFAELLGDERAVIDAVVDAAWRRCARPDAEGTGLAADAVREEPAPVARLMVRRLIAGAGLTAGALERAHVERVLALVPGGGRVSLPGGATAALENGCLRVFGRSASAAGPAPARALPVPGRVPFGAVHVCAHRGPARPPTPDQVSVTDGPGDLCVRPVRPGERIHLAGGGRRPLGRLLADAGVPARLRDRVPVVARGDEVLWLVGHRADDRALASPGAPATILSVRPAS